MKGLLKKAVSVVTCLTMLPIFSVTHINANAAPVFYWPCDTSIDISCGYYGYSGHGGTDFGCSIGSPVYASRSGTVHYETVDYGCTGTHYAYAPYCDNGDWCPAYQASQISADLPFGISVSLSFQVYKPLQCFYYHSDGENLQNLHS